jgi:hypothetical protein
VKQTAFILNILIFFTRSLSLSLFFHFIFSFYFFILFFHFKILNSAAYVLDQLFDAFDVNQDGVVDFPELTSGLSVLCDGSRDDKVRAAFDLYDFNRDGYITMDEITRYLTAVFRVLYKTSKSTRESLKVSPEELGAVTAQQCFAEADLIRRVSSVVLKTK